MTSSKTLTAVLGPTNTGKTHLAVERMIAHPTGMIGLPLRLLAREVYDKVAARCGAAAVALVTGEEKIIPPGPRYWVCTVEAMPDDIDVSFLAIDEVQLAADLDRGHIFTDRILHRRGRTETMLLGASTMTETLKSLLPGLSFVSRPRFSRLAYAGQKKITRLPRRSAIVGFSTEQVYTLAELIRRQRGGAAVVLGALSPRTRNAQVELYQSGDVDYMVATDAIGMGLNMDVEHVAFAATRKFDGFQFRDLTAAEMGQIAGRAGRYMQDGTFGVSAEAEPLSADLIERLEDHRFEPVRVVQWRNRNLNFADLDRLQASLLALPNRAGLTRAQPAADVNALEFVARDEAIRARADSPERVKLLWDVCQIPDYRNISGGEHAAIVARIYQFITERNHLIDVDWFARQLSYCDRVDGDLDTLSNRISHIRTWTFVANRADWLPDPWHWQGRTREIEDRLSDALHERLTQRFIDRRTSVLLRRLRQKEDLMSNVDQEGAIFVEGEYVGRMKGLDFVPDGITGTDGKAIRAASLKAVAQEVSARAAAIAATPDTELSLDAEGAIIWQDAVVARLSPGASLLKPRVELTTAQSLDETDAEAVRLRLQKFLARHIEGLLAPLFALENDEEIQGLARGVAFQVVENLGVLPREQVADEVKSLDQSARGSLRKHGVRFGAFHIFIPTLLKPAATQLRLLLWALKLEQDGGPARADIPAMPGQGLTSTGFDPSTPKGFYRTAGFRVCGTRVVRVDMLERLADLIRERVFWKPDTNKPNPPEGTVAGGGFTVTADMMSLVGCSGEEFASILKSLGFRLERRPADKVIAPLQSAPQAAATAAETAAETAPEAAAQPAPDNGTATETAAEPSAPVEATAEAEPAADGTAETATDAATGPAGAPAADAEPPMVDVWWPGRAGAFRRPERRPQRDARPRQPGRGKAAGGGKPQHGKNKPQHAGGTPRPPRPPRPEKKIDPDSPFAALASLKAELAGKK